MLVSVAGEMVLLIVTVEKMVGRRKCSWQMDLDVLARLFGRVTPEAVRMRRSMMELLGLRTVWRGLAQEGIGTT